MKDANSIFLRRDKRAWRALSRLVARTANGPQRLDFTLARRSSDTRAKVPNLKSRSLEGWLSVMDTDGAICRE
jgi:hypothetical protein